MTTMFYIVPEENKEDIWRAGVDGNGFDSEIEAWEALDNLLDTNPDWAAIEWTVVEFDE